MAVGLAVAFEVFQGVFQLNAVVLEEGVDFHAGVEAQQAAQLGSGHFAGTVGFERQGFQGSARQVLALGGEGRQELVWKQNGEVLHGLRILEEWRKSTSGGDEMGKSQALGTKANREIGVPRAEMSAPKISAMENEPRNLTIGTLIRVAHALDSRVEIKLVRRKGTKAGRRHQRH